MRIAMPVMPRPSGRAASADNWTFMDRSRSGPAAATFSRNSASGFSSAIAVEVKSPPRSAASQTNSNSSARDLARVIASFAALSAANMRVVRSRCSSALAFSAARSKLSSAKETFSAMRENSAMISSSVAHARPTKNISTPMLLPPLIMGTATQAMTPASRRASAQAPLLAVMSALTADFRVRNASPATPRP